MKVWTLIRVSKRLWMCWFAPCWICRRRRLAVAGQRPAPRVVMHTFISFPPCSGETQAYSHRNLKDMKHSDLSLLGQLLWPVSSLIDRPSLSLSLHHLCFSLSSSHLFSIFWPAPLSAFVRPFLCLFSLLTAGFSVLHQKLCSVSLSTFLGLVAPLVCRQSCTV